MSDSELSALSDEDEEMQHLPTPFPLESSPSIALPLLQIQPRLPNTQSPLFLKNVFSRTLLSTSPVTMKIVCMQDSCNYKPKPKLLSWNITSNLWRHVQSMHPALFEAIKPGPPLLQRAQSSQSQSSQSQSSQDSQGAQNMRKARNAQGFFTPRVGGSNPISASRYRELLLAFIVSNNLPMSLVDRPSFRQLVHQLSPSTLVISTSSLMRDLHKTFCNHRMKLQIELQAHVIKGGRLSLTTDSWSAMNGAEHAAITVHWINNEWVHRHCVLDIIHLKEPIHSGEYLAEQLQAVTDDFGITNGVFTITRDNASNNTAMLAEFEIGVCTDIVSIQQPWSFTVKEGDVRCMAHIINLAVQAALAMLKAVPLEQTESYRLEQGSAYTQGFIPNRDEVATVLIKLRRHIYVFRNRRAWKDALKVQASTMGIQVVSLSLDMPVRWNSTYHMLENALKLEQSINALCASQTMDLSMRDIIITPIEWQVLHGLKAFFKIFVKPAEQVQADNYPTLNVCIPHYLRLLNKLKAMEIAPLTTAAISAACKASYSKLDTYYNLITNQGSSHSSIATICDPRFNLSIYEFYMPSSADALKRDRARAQFAACFNRYKDRENDIQVAAIEATIAAETEQITTPRELDSDDEMYQHHGPSIEEVEWRRWLKESGVDRYTNILKYWQAKQFQYPVISRIARDYLAIPASSAASERIFSVGGDIVTKKRNRLLPSTLRYLLCLRDWGVIGDEDDDSE